MEQRRKGSEDLTLWVGDSALKVPTRIARAFARPVFPRARPALSRI
jgi:hypothetical protein